MPTSKGKTAYLRIVEASDCIKDKISKHFLQNTNEPQTKQDESKTKKLDRAKNKQKLKHKISENPKETKVERRKK